jgi:hypothetical protein
MNLQTVLSGTHQRHWRACVQITPNGRLEEFGSPGKQNSSQQFRTEKCNLKVTHIVPLKVHMCGRISCTKQMG